MPHAVWMSTPMTVAYSQSTIANILTMVPRYFNKKGKGCPHSITEHRVPELIPVLGSQPAGDVSHKPGGRLPVLSARPAVTPQPLRGQSAAAIFAVW